MQSEVRAFFPSLGSKKDQPTSQWPQGKVEADLGGPDPTAPGPPAEPAGPRADGELRAPGPGKGEWVASSGVQEHHPLSEAARTSSSRSAADTAQGRRNAGKDGAVNTAHPIQRMKRRQASTRLSSEHLTLPAVFSGKFSSPEILGTKSVPPTEAPRAALGAVSVPHWCHWPVPSVAATAHWEHRRRCRTRGCAESGKFGAAGHLTLWQAGETTCAPGFTLWGVGGKENPKLVFLV